MGNGNDCMITSIIRICHGTAKEEGMAAANEYNAWEWDVGEGSHRHGM